MNDIRKICQDEYQKYVKDQPIPVELKRALRAHERIPLFIDNMAHQFAQCEKRNVKVSREQIISAVRDLTKIFILNVTQQAEERAMSPIKKAHLKAKASQIADMKKLGDALVNKGDAIEEVTQDKKGNQTSKATVIFDEERFV